MEAYLIFFSVWVAKVSQSVLAGICTHCNTSAYNNDLIPTWTFPFPKLPHDMIDHYDFWEIHL